jgi:hypothetical protein
MAGGDHGEREEAADGATSRGLRGAFEVEREGRGDVGVGEREEGLGGREGGREGGFVEGETAGTRGERGDAGEEGGELFRGDAVREEELGEGGVRKGRRGLPSREGGDEVAEEPGRGRGGAKSVSLSVFPCNCERPLRSG